MTRLAEAILPDYPLPQYVYEDHGNILSAINRQGQTQSWTYDNRSRLTKETKANGETIDHVYDLAGNQTSLTITEGTNVRTTSYAFDALNRLSQVTKPNTEITTYAYDPAGNLVTESAQNGNHIERVYNAVNQLTDVVHHDSLNNITLQFNYTLDATGRRTGIQESSGRINQFTYDDLYRLTSETITDAVNGNASTTFGYDKVGNRISKTVDAIQTLSSYDNNDRLTQKGGTTYSYDNNGNTLTETLNGNVTSYSYNMKNELTSVTKDGITTEYGYNVNGIRTSKTENGITIVYLVDENQPYAQVLKESDGSNETYYTHGLDLLSQDRNGAQSDYLYDGLGSTRALTDSSGTITDTYDYTADGITLNQTGTTENNYLFTGEQHDSETGNYYLRARYYDPSRPGFTQMDSWEGIEVEPLSLNKYIYGEADPVTNVDPSGNISVGIGGQLAAIGALGYLTTTAVSTYKSGGGSSDGVSFNLRGSNLTIASIYFSYIDYINTFSLSMDNVLIMSGSGSATDAAQRQADYEAYKYGPCDPKNQIPPPGMSACQAALWKLNVVKQCRDMRQEWDDKWEPGKHAQEIDNIGRWILKLEKIVEKACK